MVGVPVMPLGGNPCWYFHEFFTEPASKLSDNTDATPEMLQVAIEFVDELIQLGSIE